MSTTTTTCPSTSRSPLCHLYVNNISQKWHQRRVTKRSKHLKFDIYASKIGCEWGKYFGLVVSEVGVGDLCQFWSILCDFLHLVAILPAFSFEFWERGDIEGWRKLEISASTSTSASIPLSPCSLDCCSRAELLGKTLAQILTHSNCTRFSPQHIQTLAGLTKHLKRNQSVNLGSHFPCRVLAGFLFALVMGA